VGTSRPRGRFAGRTELEPASHDELPGGAEQYSHREVNKQSWLRSFGRRKGRKLSESQSSLLSEGLERLKIDLSARVDAGRLAQIFSTPVDDVWLEIGFGAGEHLIWQAEHNPRVGLIGAEPYINGVVSALAAARERDLEDRLRIHPEDAIPLLDWLPAASLARAFMLFPDPWPKTRHRTRRLFSPFLLDKLSRVLSPGAEFRFASDIASYVDAAIGHAETHPAFGIVQVFTSKDRATVPDWPATRYETKAVRAGRPATFLVMKRKADPLPGPED
jgi:tRNA (guanine-N7-)-methyltransferase